MIAIKVTGRLDTPEFHIAKEVVEIVADQFKRDVSCEITPLLEKEWMESIAALKTERGDLWDFTESVVCYVDNKLYKSVSQFLEYINLTYKIVSSGNDAEEVAKNATKEYYRNPKRDFVYLDITHDDNYIGRLVLELFTDICPKTCANFKSLCEGNIKSEVDKALSYEGCSIHRIVKRGYFQSGDLINNNGTGETSIYDESTFPDENFIVEHNGSGILSMANHGLHTNASQFCISFRALPWMNKKYVAFGKVVEGYAVLQKLEEIDTIVSGQPRKPCSISKCGLF